MADDENKFGKWLDKGMCGVLPVYDERGANISLIIFDGSPSVYEYHRVKTVIKRLAQLFYKDITLIKREAREISRQRTGNALPISYNIVLVPFKVRKPIGRDDGSFGYIFSSNITKVSATDSNTYLYLKDGQIIPILDSAETARRRIIMANYITDKMLNNCRGRYNPNPILNEERDIYNEPATKGDICLLLSKFLTRDDDKF